MTYDLKKKFAQAPLSPGVYQMINAQGKVIYVGKAKQLKKRLLQYLATNLSIKTAAMISQVVDVEISLTSTPEEALLLEANLIKSKKPKYNILLRDDKSYPFLRLSDEVYPRVTLYRGSRREKGMYFGPYPDSRAVRQASLLVQKIFRLRTCDNHFFKHRSRPCLQYQINRCSAPCVGLVSQASYDEQIRHATEFLQGNNTAALSGLRAQMEAASSALNFEKAAQLRDQIAILKRVQQPAISSGPQDVDLVVSLKGGGIAVVCVCMIRHGALAGKVSHVIALPLGEEQSFMEEFLMSYYLSPLRGNQALSAIYVDQPVDDASVLESVLNQNIECAIKIKSRFPKILAPWRRLALINARHTFDAHHSKVSSWFKKMADISHVVKSEFPIRTIECFDISHTSGRETRGSCVVFDQSGKQPSRYRQYAVALKSGGDDYAAMSDVLWRRYKKMLIKEKSLPDMILIDGGKGQIKVAAQVINDLQIQGVYLASIVKGDHRRACFDRLLLYPSMKYITLKDHPSVLFAIQQVRDEAHRFAIKVHRQERKKQVFRSPLDNIEGVGPVLRKRLLAHFGGMGMVLRASVEGLMQVEGISLRKAQHIHRSLHHYKD